MRLSLVLTAAAAVARGQGPACRDQNTWPFSNDSIWNTAIGSGAQYAAAGIFAAGKPQPESFFSDDDYFIVTQASDPQVPWYSQGWWGQPSGFAHCNVSGPLVGPIHFPANLTVTEFGNNNAAALLQPDNRTLVLTQPLYVCGPGAPVLSILDKSHGTTDIRGPGTWGGHGGSSLSAIGGTIRLGELLPGSGPIQHALKLELNAVTYYWPGRDPKGSPCFTWPALNCDGYAHDNCTTDPHCYNGSNPLLRPGALLAVPPSVASQLAGQLRTAPGRVILAALTDYGGYLVDDTYANRGTFCTEHGVTDEFTTAWGWPFNAQASSSGSEYAWYSDLLAIFQSLSIIANNSPGSIGGGGAPRQPPPPPFC